MESIKIIEIMNWINKGKGSSAWNRGVKLYAMEILEKIADEGNNEISFDENGKMILKKWWIFSLSQGFNHWIDASKCGEFLIYDRDIAVRLCTASELQRTKWGMLNPNKSESWIECQGRALYQARCLIIEAIRSIRETAAA